MIPITTRAKIEASLAKNPVQTLQQVATEVGVTRERVRQITKEYGIHREALPSRYGRCISCGRTRHDRRVNNILECGICRPNRAKYITVNCYWCNKSFSRRASSQRSKRSFCNNVCLGKWVAENYGWGSKYQADRGMSRNGTFRPKGEYRKQIESLTPGDEIVITHTDEQTHPRVRIHEPL